VGQISNPQLPITTDRAQMEMLYPESVVAFAGQRLPSLPRDAQVGEHAAFDAVDAMNELHLYITGKGSLVAELTLKNEGSGTSTVKRTPVVARGPGPVTSTRRLRR
jgi:hypothetical protein